MTMRSMISSAASSVTVGESSVPRVHELVDPEELTREFHVLREKENTKENTQHCSSSGRALSASEQSRQLEPDGSRLLTCPRHRGTL